MRSLKTILSVLKRELYGYVTSPMAYVLMAFFVILNMAFGFLVSNFLKKGDASLTDFFMWHPWFYMLIGPALGMRLWSEEQRLGTMELLMTMPVAVWEVIVGKFLAACTVLLMALGLTFSMVVTVNLLGDPDTGVIFSGYLGSFLVGATALAITCAISAVTRNQVACLLISFFIILGLVLAGFPPFQDYLMRGTLLGIPLSPLAKPLASASFFYHSNLLGQGLLTIQSLVYFITLIAYCLFLTSVIIRSKRS
ncbi:MAG: ABC transporter permease subunit [Verrucomicrobiales bacterium]|nr:ABC transporter permease subunit [Verrucomicrobiales bacterium]